MVDINLIGDDKDRTEGDENTDNFSDTYSADSRELTSGPHYSDPDIDHNINIYDRNYARGGSRKAIFFVVGLVILVIILAVGYYLTNIKKKSQLAKTNEATIPEVEAPTITTPDEMNLIEKPAVDIPVFVKDKITATQHGIKTVETILSAMPQGVNFTMIQYRDGNFLAEILGRAAANISDLNNRLQQNFPGDNIRILSQDRRNIMGYTYQQALLNGNITDVGGGVIVPPVYMEPSRVKNEFSEYCKQLDLSLKQFETKNEILSGEYKEVPVILRAVGKKDAALNLLNKIVENNLNVNLSKIVFIASDRNINNNKIVLYLNMEIFRPI